VSQPKLPSAFGELERFVEKWDRPGTAARYAERVSSSMAELTDFHDHMMSRAQEIIAHLDRKKFAEYSDEDTRLARLMFAFAIAAQAVEVYKTQVVPDTGSARFEYVTETEITPNSVLMKV